MANICVIPARMQSTRFPGKPLRELLGLPLVLHIYHRCRLCDSLDRVVIATCDEEIRRVGEAAGAEVVMTADTHPGCVDRTSEAIDLIGGDLADDDLVLMVQGDEVLVAPDMLTEMIAAHAAKMPPVVNLISRLYRDEDRNDPNCVKVVSAPDGTAIYFSRSPIPSFHHAEDSSACVTYQQTGVIGFSKAFVKTFGTLARTPIEKTERIDMMRVVEHGLPIVCVATETETLGVDTPEDLRRAEGLLRDTPVTATYLDTST